MSTTYLYGMGYPNSDVSWFRQHYGQEVEITPEFLSDFATKYPRPIPFLVDWNTALVGDTFENAWEDERQKVKDSIAKEIDSKLDALASQYQGNITLEQLNDFQRKVDEILKEFSQRIITYEGLLTPLINLTVKIASALED